jgi:hypothetical protein
MGARDWNSSERMKLKGFVMGLFQFEKVKENGVVIQ